MCSSVPHFFLRKSLFACLLEIWRWTIKVIVKISIETIISHAKTLIILFVTKLYYLPYVQINCIIINVNPLRCLNLKKCDVWKKKKNCQTLIHMFSNAFIKQLFQSLVCIQYILRLCWFNFKNLPIRGMFSYFLMKYWVLL